MSADEGLKLSVRERQARLARDGVGATRTETQVEEDQLKVLQRIQERLDNPKPTMIQFN